MARKGITGVAFLCSALVLANIAAAGPIALSYSPDSQVDANGTRAYAEPAIVSDPLDSKTLVAAAESASFSEPPETFISRDGGYQWSAAPLLLNSGSLFGDVQLASDPDGKIYFAALGWPGRSTQISQGGIHVFALARHGTLFRHLSFIGGGRIQSIDHEQLTIDGSRGPYRGRIYMSLTYLLHGWGELGVVWSGDGGRHFQGPVPVIVSRTIYLNGRPVVLSNGTLLVPFWQRAVQRRITATTRNLVSNVEVVLSQDGGRTFSAPRVVGTYTATSLPLQRIDTGRIDFDSDPVPQFAAGKSPVTHREVVYAIWSDIRTGNSRLLFTESTDDGQHWKTPVPILATANTHDAQYQVSIAVNQQGVLGIAYMQHLSATGRVTEMFADSVDGGVTFSEPVPIQSQPAGLARLGYGYSTSSVRLPFRGFNRHILIFFEDPVERFPSGGDYVEMAIDRNGAFHPIWVDARTGTYQVWTASVTPGLPQNASMSLRSADVTSNIDVQFGTSKFDAAKHMLSIQVRLRNDGERPLYPPFKVTVLTLYNPAFSAMWRRRFGMVESAVVNADNGRHGAGAIYAYGPRTLGDLGVLTPGAETAPRTWKIVLNGNRPAISVRVDGYESR